VHESSLAYPGGASLRRRTLHRVMNELIGSWEDGAGVKEFVILTAQASEAHLEALSTIRTDGATVQVIDVFGLDFGELLEFPDAPVQGGELDTSLILFLAPDLVRMDLSQDFALSARTMERFRPGQSRELPGSPGSVGYPSRASPQKGAVLYRFILDHISRCLKQPEASGA